MRREWTEEEVAYLEKYYERRGVDYIAKRLNRTVDSVRHIWKQWKKEQE